MVVKRNLIGLPKCGRIWGRFHLPRQVDRNHSDSPLVWVLIICGPMLHIHTEHANTGAIRQRFVHAHTLIWSNWRSPSKPSAIIWLIAANFSLTVGLDCLTAEPKGGEESKRGKDQLLQITSSRWYETTFWHTADSPPAVASAVKSQHWRGVLLNKLS